MAGLMHFVQERQAVEYEEVDLHKVMLSGFTEGVKAEDVAGLCAGVIETGMFLKGNQLVHCNSVYAINAEAVAAVQALDGALIKGCPIKATYTWPNAGMSREDAEWCIPSAWTYTTCRVRSS
ncbi:hypothetical protein HPB50_029283 [Hyalomma asiaticum]|nr:hypothetical protein HPB50_029283 [Hyalomma asiaticum]